MKYLSNRLMKRHLLAVTAACVCLVLAGNVVGDEGDEKRILWTPPRVKGSPEPPLPFITERAYPQLKFDKCLDLTTAPGSDRVLVLEQGGKLFSFVDSPDASSRDLVIDFAKQISDVKNVYAFTLHPKFEQNGYLYACFIKAPNQDDGTLVARFSVSKTDPPTIDVRSQKDVITWRSGGHNGCCLKFGPDGFLYISTGDAAPANPPDTMKTGQDISDLLSSILRLDVDHPEEGQNYRIPQDNPFVDHEGARGEIWAYGLRNPWRMSFDRKTGDLWCGDVGWELWEMLYRIDRGGNYGWAVTEGPQSTHPEWPRGPTPILPPTIDHLHTESSSITEGLTYYGSQLKELHGVHIYGDYDTGKFWGFRFDDGRVVDHRELADTTHRVVGFGEDTRGELLIIDHIGGTLHRLVPNPQRAETSDFPRQLSESGLFSSIGQLTPAAGVVAYSINAEPWADHATAERLVAVPGEESVRPGGKAWSFPKDSVLVKTLSLEMKAGDPQTRRRIETQLLHFDGREWLPYTYEWNDEQTDAALVGATGSERLFEIRDENAPDGVRQQTWRFAGRAECQRCHNKWSGPPLGFQTAQLNVPATDGDESVDQLSRLVNMRLIDQSVPEKDRPQLANPGDTRATIESRARAYLHANCGHCHRKHAGGAVLSHMHFDLALKDTNMLRARPTQGTFGIHAAQVIAPGDVARSVLLYRISKLGGGRMPRLGSSEVDRSGVALIANWLAQLPAGDDTEAAGGETAVRIRHAESVKLKNLLAATSAEAQAQVVDELLTSTTGALRLLRAVDSKTLSRPATVVVISRATRHSDVRIRDLFERFLTPAQRIKRLGTTVRPEQILSLSGDAARGRKVFFEASGVSCKNCHRIGKEGRQVGPELTVIGKKQTKAQLLESILEPSKRIDPKFVTYLVETTQGSLISGLLVSRTDKEVVLKDGQSKEQRIPAEDVELIAPQQKSLMPELLVRDMTAQQVADLLALLQSLK